MCNSTRYASADFVGVVEEGGRSEEGGGRSEVASGGGRADGGTDFRASERTSTVSRRSDAKRVMAKSRVCSFSRAEFRCKFKKSACR